MRDILRIGLAMMTLVLCWPEGNGFSQEDRDENAVQGPPAPAEPSYEMDTLVVRSATIRESADDPSSFATVIKPADFASQFRTTDELLSQVPGVNLNRFGGLGQYSTVSIRGSSSEQVLVLLDGVKLNTGEGGAVDFSTIPLDSIERIEVIRGGGTTLYGSDAIGGVVNLITKKAADRPQVSAGVTYGSLNTVKGWATASAGSEVGSALVSATHLQSDGDFEYETPEIFISGEKVLDSTEAKRLNNDFFSENVLAKAEFSPFHNWECQANNDLFYTERGQPGSVFSPREQARQDLLRNLTHIGVEGRDVLFHDLQLSLTLFNRYDRNHFRDPEPSLGVPGLPGLNSIDTLTEEYSYGVKPTAELYRSLWGAEHAVSFRGEFRRDELRDEVEPWQQGYDDPTRTSYEWHLQDEVVFFGDRLSLIPAVRYEESTDFGGHWTGKIGLLAKPRYWLHVRSNFENSFRKPSFSELYYPDQGYIRGNPDLDPEKALNLDAGVGLDLPRFFLEVAYFRNWIEESILWLPVSIWTVQPVNTGRVDQWGVELDTEYRPLNFLLLSANYTYLDAESQETGQQQDGRPKHTANFKGSLRGDIGELYSELQYQSSIPVHFTDTSQISVSGRLLLNLGVSYNLLSVPVLARVKWIEKWTLGFEVKNVTDASVYDSQYYPLPGRMFFGTMHAAL